MSFSDSEILDRRFVTPEPIADYGRKSVDSELYMRESKPLPPMGRLLL